MRNNGIGRTGGMKQNVYRIKMKLPDRFVEIEGVTPMDAVVNFANDLEIAKHTCIHNGKGRYSIYGELEGTDVEIDIEKVEQKK